MLPSMRVMVRLAKNNPNIHSSMLEPTSSTNNIDNQVFILFTPQNAP